MENQGQFRINVKNARKTAKSYDKQIMNQLDQVSEEQGYPSRAPRHRGRVASPRTRQIHAWVLPEIGEELSNEALRRGVQQGVIIEEWWRQSRGE